MKKFALSTALVCTIALSGFAVHLTNPFAVQPTHAQDAASDNGLTQQTITMIGSGNASAPADSADVQLAVGGSSVSYGPEGPQFRPYDEENLELVTAALIALDIDEESIHTNAFGRSDFGPGGSTGVVRFTYDEPQELNTFMTALLEELDANRGPDIHGMTVVFQVEDCAALETEAMEIAVTNARDRATQLATVLEVELDGLQSVSELGTAGSSASGAVSGSTCANLQNATHEMGFNPFASGGRGENSPSIVDVSVGLEVVFEVK